LEDHIRTFKGSYWRRRLGENRRSYQKKKKMNNESNCLPYQKEKKIS
jgi:hypothetical protein